MANLNPFPPGGLKKHPGYVPPKRYVSDEDKAIVARTVPQLAEHVDHGVWEIIGRCVYCVRCPAATEGESTRLYQAR